MEDDKKYSLYDIYLNKLIESLFKMDYNFLLSYAPATLTQYSMDAENKFKNLSNEQYLQYKRIALLIIDDFAPSAVIETKEN